MFALSLAALAAPAVVAIAGVEPSPAASTALEDTTPGLVEALRGVAAAGGLRVVERADDLFGRELATPTVVVGGYARRASCQDERQISCSVKVRWELYDTRARRVVRAYTARGTGSGEDRVAAAQQALAASLFEAISVPAFADGVPVDATLPPPAWREPATIPSCPASTANLPSGVEGLLDSVVILRTRGGTGSGVVVSPEGHIATAAHVVDLDQAVEVVLRNGVVLPAEILRVDQAFDVALLDVEGTGWPCRTLATTAPRLGDEVFVVGAPLGTALGWSLTRGVVSGIRATDGRTVLQTDAAINPGNSGGPLLDRVGIVTALASSKLGGGIVEGLGFAVPASVWTTRLNVLRGTTKLPADDAREAWIFVDAGSSSEGQ